ncbi:hypothetical protein DL764_005011 [Monosporascus ibericus]|uniref:Uncharacterized protein n=1 Tax=Monosporascus ibericus TaxID=155417 RepID=A0A4Q4TCH1_9PEZI|nr:hypothetical protein DL764_005011 [Monosporascus ibericus]
MPPLSHNVRCEGVSWVSPEASTSFADYDGSTSSDMSSQGIAINNANNCTIVDKGPPQWWRWRGPNKAADKTSAAGACSLLSIQSQAYRKQQKAAKKGSVPKLHRVSRRPQHESAPTNQEDEPAPAPGEPTHHAERLEPGAGCGTARRDEAKLWTAR